MRGSADRTVPSSYGSIRARTSPTRETSRSAGPSRRGGPPNQAVTLALGVSSMVAALPTDAFTLYPGSFRTFDGSRAAGHGLEPTRLFRKASQFGSRTAESFP